MKRNSYPSDLTDEQWLLIEPHIPPEKHGGRHRKVDMRQIINGLLYQSRTGCQWRALPGGFNRAISDPHFGFSAGLEVEIPIGNRHARAELARRRLIRRQLMTQMLDDAQNIARDIADDLVNLTQDWRQIRMAHARKESAFAVLRGLRVQERAGQVLNPTFLQLELNAQRDLAQARIADVQARTNYCADMVRFERDKGTLLQFDRVAVTPQ